MFTYSKRVVIVLFLFISFLGFVFAGLVLADDYIIGAGDVLQVSVWGSPEFSVETPVRPDGKMTLPAVGEVVAEGLTPQQLSKKLEEVIKKFIKRPIVTLSVTQITNNKIFISGGGVGSGVISLPGKTTLFKLLCQLDNIRETDLTNAYLSRNGTKLLTNFYPLFMDGDLSQDVALKANDILHIPANEVNKVYVVGAVTNPQAVSYIHGMKVLDAILAAGGFEEFAKQSKVVIMRRDGKQLTVDIEDLLKGKDIKQNVSVSPGDYVIVRESMF